MTLRQQPLYHDKRIAGFWATVRVGNTVEIDDTAWRNAIADGTLVGTCRDCGNYLTPGEPYQVGQTWWYPATCTTDGCQYQLAGHGPRPPKPKPRTGTR